MLRHAESAALCLPAPLPSPLQISLLRVANGGSVVSVGDIVASVERPEGTAASVLFVRFFEGEGAAAVGLGGAKDRPAEQRLQVGPGGSQWVVGRAGSLWSGGSAGQLPHAARRQPYSHCMPLANVMGTCMLLCLAPLQTLLDGLVDVPLIMSTMPEAIKRAVVYAR